MAVEQHPHLDLEEKIEELASKVIGPQRTVLAGGGRIEDEGLIHRVDDMMDRVGTMQATQQEIMGKISNGGIRVKVPPTLWVAIISGLAGILVQLIATFS